MFVTRHDLPHEFPEHVSLIAELRTKDPEFEALIEQYDALDEEIVEIEQNDEHVSDAYFEELKMKRVHLKDRLYAMLRDHAAA